MHSCSAAFLTLRAPQMGQFREQTSPSLSFGSVRKLLLLVCLVFETSVNPLESDVQLASDTLRF